MPHTASSLHPKTHDNIDELSHIDHYNQHLKEHAPKRELWVAGVVIACAIALHNIPEGMSIGASYNIDTEGGLVWSSHALSRSITFPKAWLFLFPWSLEG